MDYTDRELPKWHPEVSHNIYENGYEFDIPKRRKYMIDLINELEELTEIGHEIELFFDEKRYSITYGFKTKTMAFLHRIL